LTFKPKGLIIKEAENQLPLGNWMNAKWPAGAGTRICHISGKQQDETRAKM